MLARYRTRLEENRREAPLFDMNRYARDFAEAMEAVWAEHAESQ